MARAIDAHPWDATPLGAIDRWPSALQTTLALVLSSRLPQAIIWGPELTTLYNDAFQALLGDRSEALGRGFHDVWIALWPTFEPLVERGFAGEASHMDDIPLAIDRGGHIEDAHFTLYFSPVRGEAGRIAGLLIAAVETTEAIHARKQASSLHAQLGHRIQNTFAITSAIVEQTFRAGHSLDETRRRITERIAALGRAHRLLARMQWDAIPIMTLVAEALAQHAPAEQLEIEGPALSLPAKQALSLSLALHELVTNAVRFGALSTPSGRVRIEWRLSGSGLDREFHFTWAELHGPVVAKAPSKGFGARFLEKVLPHDFGGASHLAYTPAGLRFELTRSEPFSMP